MGDLPPEIDEIIRQNKCMHECALRHLACGRIWEKLFDEKKIGLERAVSEINHCLKVHDEEIARCVPTRRHFDDEQKAHFTATKGRFRPAAIVLAVIGVVASRTAPGIGRSLAVTGITFATVSYALEKIEIDPIDPNFSEVPVPSFPKLPAIQPVPNTGLTASVAQAVDAVIANQEEAIGLLNA